MFTWLASRLTGRHKGKQANQMAEQLYASIVAQARQPFFYSELGIADTIPGRFELVALHMFIVLDRLANRGGMSDEVAQALVDVMFQDMDDVARETGVGDMGVGPRIKKLARSFQSRLQYYKLAIEGDGNGKYVRGTLPEAIIAIHFADDMSQMSNANRLARYVLTGQAMVADMSLEEMAVSSQLFDDPGQIAKTQTENQARNQQGEG
jgi:cytochrome b pre-mRNA-processing protein 3